MQAMLTEFGHEYWSSLSRYSGANEKITCKSIDIACIHHM